MSTEAIHKALFAAYDAVEALEDALKADAEKNIPPGSHTHAAGHYALLAAKHRYQSSKGAVKLDSIFASKPAVAEVGVCENVARD